MKLKFFKKFLLSAGCILTLISVSACTLGGETSQGSYNELSEKPSIEGIELIGNKTLTQLGITENIQDEIDAALYDLDLTDLLEYDLSGYAKKNEIITSYNDLTNKPVLFNGNYEELTNKPIILTTAEIQEQIDRSISAIEFPEFSENTAEESVNYATEEYVNAAISNIQIPEIPTTELIQTLINTSINNIPATDLTGYATENHVNTVLDGYTTTAELTTLLESKADITDIIKSYNELTDKPILFSGNYDELTNKPSIPDLSGYATESYVNTSISNIQFPEVLTNEQIQTLIDTSVSNISAMDLSGYTTTAELNNLLAGKANATEMNSALASKANTADVNTALANKVSTTDMDTALASKANKTEIITSYNLLTDKPTIITNYNDLTNKPVLFSGSYNDLTNKPTLVTSYNQLTDRPIIPTMPDLSGYATTAQVNLKQDKLTASQLSVVNSGITYEKVTEILNRLNALENNVDPVPLTYIDYTTGTINIAPGDVIEVGALLNFEEIWGTTIEPNMLFEFVKSGDLFMTDMGDYYEGIESWGSKTAEQIKEQLKNDMATAYNEPITSSYNGSYKGMTRIFSTERGPMSHPNNLDVRSGRFRIVSAYGEGNYGDHLWIHPAKESYNGSGNRGMDFGWNGPGASNANGGDTAIILDDSYISYKIPGLGNTGQGVWWLGSNEGCIIRLVDKNW